jgi:hypothetical protein
MIVLHKYIAQPLRTEVAKQREDVGEVLFKLGELKIWNLLKGNLMIVLHNH